MNNLAASYRVSMMFKLVIPHLMRNPEGKAKRPTAFYYALTPALWIPAFAGMT
jgi:hypothetical protein